MNRLFNGGSFSVLALILSMIVGATGAFAQETKAPISSKDAAGRLRQSALNFLENKGQWDQRARFLARTPGMDYWVTSQGLLFDHYIKTGKGDDAKLKGHVIGMDLVGGRKDAKSIGLGRTSLKTDFLNSSLSEFVQGARSYGKVLVKDVYENVDLKTYVDQGSPRYDFYVRPGGDASQIKFNIKGANSVKVSRGGDLVVGTSLGDVKQAGLYAYQTINGKPVKVSARFIKLDDTTVGFELGAYDRTKTLVIDPLVYGSYYGGDNGWDEVRAVVANADGGVFITGGTRSPVFPNIAGPYGFTLQGTWDAYVSKFQGDAYSHDYAAFVGGALDEVGDKLQLDPFGDLWVAGRTESSNLPGNTRPNVQYIRMIAGGVDGGQFRLSFGGDETNQLPWNATAAQVQAELEGLPGMTGMVTCTGGPLPDQIRCEFDNSKPFKLFMLDRKRINIFGFETIEGIEPAYVIRPEGLAPINPQTITHTGSTPTSGTWNITFTGDPGGTGTPQTATTTPLPFNATAAQVQAALAALPSVGGVANVAAAGGPLPNNDIVVTFQAALAGPQQRMVINYAGLQPVPDYETFVFTDIFVMRWKNSATNVLDPLPTRTFMIGAQGFDETNYSEPPGGTLEPFGKFFNPIAGFGIVPKDNPLATDPVEMVIASSSINDIPGIPGAVDGLDGFIYRFIFQNDIFTDVPAASKYVGGFFDDDLEGLAVDAEGNMFVAGTVGGLGVIDTSLNPAAFETTPGVFADGRLLRGVDAYVRKYDRTGTLLYSALLGGNGDDTGHGVAVDNTGNAYVVGIARSFNFPRTRGVFGETFDSNPNVTVTKINLDASEITYSTNLKTTGRVIPHGIAVDSRGQAYVAGIVGFSLTFPVPPGDPNEPNGNTFGSITTTPDAIQGTYTSPTFPELPTHDAFLVALNQNATALLHGTYIGGLLDEQAFAPYTDRFGDVWVVGSTDSFRRYVRVSSTGTQTIYQRTNVALPAQWITPLAFKATPDASPGLGTGVSGVPYGAWESPFTSPQTISSNYKRDGFLVKLRLGLPTITSVVMNPSSIAGGLGASSTGTVTLSSAAPAGGLDVTITLNNTAASFDPNTNVPSMVLNFPQGATTGTFTVYSNVVTAATPVQVRATLEGNFKIALLTVEPWLTQLTVSPTVVVGGNTVVGRVRLFQPATEDMVIALSSDNSGLLSFPPTVTVPAGLDTITFPIDTEGVVNQVDVPITASFLGVGKSQIITLKQAALLSVTFNPARVTGGTQTIGKVTLDGEAGGTFTVNLTIDAGTAGYVVNPTTLTFNQGDREKTFTVDTVFEPVNTQRKITATRPAQGAWLASTAQGTLFIDAANLIGFTVSGTTMPIGGTLTGTVTISAPAATGGAVVTLTSSDPNVASVPASVTIPAGATSATFPITATTTALTADASAIITATRGPTSIQRTVTVTKTTLGLSLNPSVVVGGQSSTGTVTLGAPAPTGGIVVSLSSNNAAAQVPVSVTIPAGVTSANFTITTSLVGSSVTAQITATAGTLVATADLEIRPVGVLEVILNPPVVRGGNPVACTVKLDAPAPPGGATVTLQAQGNAGIVILPSSVVVPAGQSQVTFTILTRRVSRTLSTSIIATFNGKSASATLTVKR